MSRRSMKVGVKVLLRPKYRSRYWRGRPVVGVVLEEIHDCIGAPASKVRWNDRELSYELNSDLKLLK